MAGQGPHGGRKCLVRGGRSTFLILRRVRDRRIKSADRTRCLSRRQSRQQVRLVTRLLDTAAALAMHADSILIDGPPQMTADTCEEIVRRYQQRRLMLLIQKKIRLDQGPTVA